MKILLVGGGSGGPVAPLLAVAAEIKKQQPQAKFLLVGTNDGPEKGMAEAAKIAFEHIQAGKLRRYFSWQNFAAPFLTIVGFFQARKILKSFRPDVVFGAGSFVQVPLVYAAWLQKIPVVLHQQDVVPSLANKLCQFCAAKITVTFEMSVNSFTSGLGVFYKKKGAEKIIHTGNPFRQELAQGSKVAGMNYFNLHQDLPVLLVLGGGTGAKFINDLIVGCLPELSKSFQVIHATGRNKSGGVNAANYHAYEFINNMADAYAVADIVLCRAGLSTITELSNLQKLSIIIPMPDSHQEINGLLLHRLGAALVLRQDKVKAENFPSLLRKVLFAGDMQKHLKENIAGIMPRGSAEKIAHIILQLHGPTK